MVAQSFTEQLDGSEPGLMAYYPFEKYVTSSGLSEIDSSLADAKVQKDPSVVIPDIIVEGGGKEILTKVSAPVKGKGPVSKLIYDFVVNNDALIITLNEPYDRIEKTIVNFTAQRIYSVDVLVTVCAFCRNCCARPGRGGCIGSLRHRQL